MRTPTGEEVIEVESEEEESEETNEDEAVEDEESEEWLDESPKRRERGIKKTLSYTLLRFI